MIAINKNYTKPMMNDVEIDIIDTLLESKPDMLCLEWGSGNSTIYFPNRHALAHWVSIEHDPEYAKYVVAHADPRKATVFTTSETPAYYGCVYPYEGMFDFILIDGILREECVKTALKIAKKDAIVLLHDAEREEYHWWLRQVPYDVLSHGEIPDGKEFYKHRGLARFIL